MREQKYPEGHFSNMGLVLGISLGIPIGLALGNIALGPAIGLAIGLALGTYFEKKYKAEGKIRPLTSKERKLKRRNLKILLGLGIAVLLGILTGYFFTK